MSAIRKFVAILLGVLTLTVVAVSPAAAVVPDAAGAVVVDGTPTASSISVTWTAGVGAGDAATGYTVTIDPADAASQPITAPTTAATFTGLDPDTDYVVSVLATNGDGDAASATDSGTITTAAAPAAVPDAPGIVSAVAGGTPSTEVDLTWTTPADNGSTITGYTITGGPAPVAVAAGETTKTITGLTPETDYTFGIVATNGVGNSAAAAFSEITTAAAPAVPDAPGIVGAAAGGSADSQVVLTWTAPAANGSALTGYTIKNGAGTTVATPGAGATSATISGLTASTAYTFTILATNGVGDSSAASFSQITTTATPTAPDAPGSFAVGSTDSTSVSLTWSAPAANGSALTGYTIKNGAGTTVATPGAGATSATISGLTPNTAYDFTIVANNGVGPSGSASANATTDAAAPSVPQNVAVSSSESSPNRLTVTWTAPATINGSAVSGYVVVVTRAGGSVIVVDPNPGAGATSVVVTGLTAGSYSAKVIALSAAGNSDEGVSGSTDVVSAPGLVTNIVAKIIAPGNVAVVSWDPPTDDGGVAIQSYTVAMAGVSATVAANQTSVSLGPLPAGSYSATINANTVAGPGEKLVSNTVEVYGFTPFFDESGFIEQQYRDFLGRAADTEGLNYWRGQNNDDRSSVTSIIIRFMESPEFAPRRSVARLYLAYFTRDPDLEGFDYWSTEIAGGRKTLQSVSDYFANGPEFKQRYGSLNNRQFVEQIYQNVLGRAGEASGVDYWTAQLDAGMTRGTMMTKVSESPEYIAATNAEVSVIVTYRGMLDRKPDAGGKAYWVNAITGDANALANLVHGFYHSAEYAARVTP